MTEDDDKSMESFEITVEDQFVNVRLNARKIVTKAVIIRATQTLYSLKAYRFEKKADLWDFRGCNTDLNYNDMNHVKNFVQMHYDSNWSHCRTAVVADLDFIYGLVRMYENLADVFPIEFEIFRNFEDAKTWLQKTTK